MTCARWAARIILFAALLGAALPANAAEAVFQGVVTCRITSAASDFSSPVKATVGGGILKLEAADRLWSMGSGKDFSRRVVNSYIVFEQSSRFGQVDFYFAGATSHIRVIASSDALLTIKPDGGVTICGGALPLVSGDLNQALQP